MPTRILLSAGGSAIFDLVARPAQAPALRRPVRGLLRSGRSCYVTHDHGFYKRMVSTSSTLGAAPASTAYPGARSVGDGAVATRPEPALAILAVGKPRHLLRPRAASCPSRQAATVARCTGRAACPRSWKSHRPQRPACLPALGRGRRGAAAPQVGDRVALGISHPCTTFDKWRWMALVDDDYRVNADARRRMHFWTP